MEYIEALKNDNIKLLIDLYHFDLESEDFNNIIKYKHYIKHVHIAKPVLRCCPKQNDGYDYFNFLNMLRASGYNGIISIEASINDFVKDIYDSKKLIESFYKES
jgi:sugar phosphate isomerase/epimerase